MERYYTEPTSALIELFNILSPGAADSYLQRVSDTVIPNIQKILACFRTLHSPVVFTAIGTETGNGDDLPGWLRAFDELGQTTLGRSIIPPVHDPSWQIDPALAPQPGEQVVNKLSAGTFATTGLEQRLRHQGIESVVVTGVTSDVCVTTTAREAADRGFQTVLVSDACTTWSDHMHTASLETFNLALGWVRSTQQVIDLLQAIPRAA
jgi:nicotinamidase-related amidase